jgi:hypothetical protein
LKLLRIFFAIDIGIVIFCVLQDNLVWFLNTQFAFFSAIMIILGSFVGYKNLVNSSLDNGNVGEDILQKYDDKYELYDEDDNDEIDVKELNKKLKEDKIPWYKAIFLSFKGGFNFLRILGYITLVAGFLWLEKNDKFDFLPYFFGLSLVPAIALVYLWQEKKSQKEN